MTRANQFDHTIEVEKYKAGPEGEKGEEGAIESSTRRYSDRTHFPKT